MIQRYLGGSNYIYLNVYVCCVEGLLHRVERLHLLGGDCRKSNPARLDIAVKLKVVKVTGGVTKVNDDAGLDAGFGQSDGKRLRLILRHKKIKVLKNLLNNKKIF